MNHKQLSVFLLIDYCMLNLLLAMVLKLSLAFLGDCQLSMF